MSDSESDKKRKRSENSSVSDLDTTKNSPSTTKSKSKQRKKESNMDAVQKDLKDIKAILSKVLTKDDPHLENLMTTTLNNMKEQFLASVSHRIDVLEHKLFEKESENSGLRETLKSLERKIEEKEDENSQLKREIENVEREMHATLNDQEQYSRRNNIRIDGIVAVEGEHAETTATKAVEMINTKIKEVNIKTSDIDIAHRIGKIKKGKQQIIVKFLSRRHAINILQHKKSLKGTGIFINEDLTAANLQALACLRKKLPDEIDSAWSRDGRVRYKNRMGNVHTLRYKEYQTWFDLPWPEAAVE